MPPAVQDLQPALTLKQWRFLEERQDQVEAGQWLTQKESAKRAGASEFVVVGWNRQRVFRRACALIYAELNDPLEPLLIRALMVRGIKGSYKHAELALKARGRLQTRDPFEDDTPGPGAAVARASVTFINIPQPPTPADRDRLSPPAGSSMIFRGGQLIDTKATPPTGGR